MSTAHEVEFWKVGGGKEPKFQKANPVLVSVLKLTLAPFTQVQAFANWDHNTFVSKHPASETALTTTQRKRKKTTKKKQEKKKCSVSSKFECNLRRHR